MRQSQRWIEQRERQQRDWELLQSERERKAAAARIAKSEAERRAAMWDAIRREHEERERAAMTMQAPVADVPGQPSYAVRGVLPARPRAKRRAFPVQVQLALI